MLLIRLRIVEAAHLATPVLLVKRVRLSLGPGDPLTNPTRLLWLLPILLLTSVSAKADTASVYVNGSYAFASYGYGIGPYGGTLNGSAASFYCIDFNHDIVGNTGWTANVTSLAISGTGTRLDNPTIYTEMAWMITQMMGTSDQTLQAEYQWAIWSLSVGNNSAAPHDYYGTNASIIGDAQKAVKGWSAGNWEILTPKGNYGQEFMVLATPEPKSLLLLLVGLAAFAVFALRK